MGERPPNEWRRILADAFADAEDHGLGTWSPTFHASAGHEDQAAAFIGERCTFLFERQTTN
jgi:hypothetical protein